MVYLTRSVSSADLYVFLLRLPRHHGDQSKRGSSRDRQCAAKDRKPARTIAELASTSLYASIHGSRSVVVGFTARDPSGPRSMSPSRCLVTD
jgi:hypothetical protein